MAHESTEHIEGEKKKRRRKSSKSSKSKLSKKLLDDEEVHGDDDERTEEAKEEEPEADNEKEDSAPQEEQKKPKRKRKRKRKSKDAADASAAAEDGSDAKASKLSSLDLTVYVEGIPFDCSEDDVRTFFVSNSCNDILQLRLPRWQDTGRLRGYGHVVFESEESRNRAINELNGMNLGKRYLSIQAPKAPRPDTSMGAMQSRTARDQPEGCRTVFVKNLPYDASEEDIRQAFQVTGKIVEGGVRIARNSQTRQSKGFAYVEYKNPEGAQGAVQKAVKPFGMTINGRPCFVDYEEGQMKGSYKTAEGRLWTREYSSTKKQKSNK